VPGAERSNINSIQKGLVYIEVIRLSAGSLIFFLTQNKQRRETRMNTGDTSFVLLSTTMVFFMTPGLALFYGGLVRKKNAVSLMIQCLIAIGVVTVVWAVCGFTIAYGGDCGGVIGDMSYAFLHNVTALPGAFASNIPFVLFCAFQLVFAIITPAIIAGGVAERFSFKAYIILLVVWSILVYAPFAHQVWGGGFLAQFGVKDFAGGIVVHMAAGFSSLAAALAIGKRKVLDYTPCNMAYVAIGGGILWAGWLCFNGGSALAANGTAGLAMGNTIFASATAMLSWVVISYIRSGHVTLLDSILGGVAGLIVVTPMAGYVQPWAAMAAGILGGAFSYGCMQFRMAREWDDTLDVWALHGMSGLLGLLLVGIFADPSCTGDAAGLIYGGGFALLGKQAVGVCYAAVYSFAVTFVIVKILKKFCSARVSDKIEDEGFDKAYHAEKLYNDAEAVVGSTKETA